MDCSSFEFIFEKRKHMYNTKHVIYEVLNKFMCVCLCVNMCEKKFQTLNTWQPKRLEDEHSKPILANILCQTCKVWSFT